MTNTWSDDTNQITNLAPTGKSYMKAQWEHSCCKVQGMSTLSDKILTEKEKFRLGYSENPDSLRLKTRGSELIQILLPSTLHLVTAMLPLGPLDQEMQKLQ
jgi:hypothetical protein